jgi:hypothetical protein
VIGIKGEAQKQEGELRWEESVAEAPPKTVEKHWHEMKEGFPPGRKRKTAR